MAHGSNNAAAPNEFVAWLGGMLMALVAGEDVRVRKVIANTATRARSTHDLEFEMRWHIAHDLAANPRVE